MRSNGLLNWDTTVEKENNSHSIATVYQAQFYYDHKKWAETLKATTVWINYARAKLPS